MAATRDCWSEQVWNADPESEDRIQISFIDIARAYFNAKISDENPIYVELPPEDEDHGRGMCARLNVHMYGTRPETWATVPRRVKRRACIARRKKQPRSCTTEQITLERNHYTVNLKASVTVLPAIIRIFLNCNNYCTWAQPYFTLGTHDSESFAKRQK